LLAQQLLDRLQELEQYRFPRDQLQQGEGSQQGLLAQYVLKRKFSKLKRSIQLEQAELVRSISAELIGN
jgi:hypothetical protein